MLSVTGLTCTCKIVCLDIHECEKFTNCLISATKCSLSNSIAGIIIIVFHTICKGLQSEHVHVYMLCIHLHYKLVYSEVFSESTCIQMKTVDETLFMILEIKAIEHNILVVPVLFIMLYKVTLFFIIQVCG